jgi:diacylglycerol kinase
MLRILHSFIYAGHGLKHCISKEKNYQLHCFAAVMAIILGMVLKITAMEWAVIVVNIALVLAFEMINTAVEHLCNIVQPGFSPLVKIIKDVNAGAVLLIAIMAVVCGGIIFIPKIIGF